MYNTFYSLSEKISFGDVVMAPPVFTAKPRKAPEIKKVKYEIFIYNILLKVGVSCFLFCFVCITFSDRNISKFEFCYQYCLIKDELLFLLC